MFTHILNSFEFREFPTVQIDGFRHYEIHGKLYPAITSILSIMNQEKILSWKKNLGEAVAKFESFRAANRGKDFHKICEDYLCNKDISIHKSKVLSLALFNLVKKELERIDDIYAIEPTLYSEKYKIAGRADCIAKFDDIISVIDFKTANRTKNKEILETHSIQETAYAIMYQELTGIKIDQIITIVACENGETQINIEKPNYFVSKLVDCIHEFRVSQKYSQV